MHTHAAELPLFDAHIHYNHDAWESVPTKEAIARLRKAGMVRALVSSSSDEGTQKLYAEAPDLIIPELRPYTGRDAKVAKYIRSFPQTQEFIRRISDLLVYLLPHYIREGKSYLTVAFGCTGGQHRSVLIAREMQKALADAGYQVKVSHRDATP